MLDLTYPPIILAAKTGFRLLGQRITMTGTEHVPRRGGVLLAYNHIGYVDFVYGGLAANPSERPGALHGQAGDLRPHRGRAADALAAPHRGRPGRGPATPSAPRWTTCSTARRSGSSRRRPSRARWSSRSSRPEPCASRPRRGRPDRAGHPVGHPADDDQGPPPRLLPRQDHLAHRRRADAPRRQRPGRGDRRAAGPDATMLDDDDRCLPGRRAAARLLVGPGPPRRHRPHARGGRCASTPRRSGPGPPSGPPSAPGADPPAASFIGRPRTSVDISLCRQSDLSLMSPST